MAAPLQRSTLIMQQIAGSLPNLAAHHSEVNWQFHGFNNPLRHGVGTREPLRNRIEITNACVRMYPEATPVRKRLLSAECFYTSTGGTPMMYDVSKRPRASSHIYNNMAWHVYIIVEVVWRAKRSRTDGNRSVIFNFSFRRCGGWAQQRHILSMTLSGDVSE